MLSALLAPVSMLAQDVRSGKLGGVCSLNISNASISMAGDAGDAGFSGADSGATVNPDGLVPEAAHCDLCASPCLALPVLALLVIPSYPGNDVATVYLPADVAAFIPGLPFSRGPPFTL